jgi:hypothetical protein
MIEFFIGVAGVFLTLMFGVFSIIVYRSEKNKTRMNLSWKECVCLSNEEINRLNRLLKNNKSDIKNPIFNFKVRLANSGLLDIDKNKVFKPIKMIAPSNIKWLRVNSFSENDNIKIKILKEGEIGIKWDLFKKGEFVDIEIIAEITKPFIDVIKEFGSAELANDSENLFNNLKFDFRITDLKFISKEEVVFVPTEIKVFSRLFNLKAIANIFCGAFILLLINLFPQSKIFSEPIYKLDYYLVSDSIVEKCRISPSSKANGIDLYVGNKIIPKSLSIESFNSKYKIESINSVKTSSRSTLMYKVLGFVWMSIGIFCLIVINIFVFVRKKIFEDIGF